MRLPYQDSFTDARNKLFVNRGNVIRQAEMLRELGVKPTKCIPEAIVTMALAEEDGAPEAVAAIEYASK